MNLMSKCNFNIRKYLNSNTICKMFSQKYDGIKGDVNWIDGILVDGRPDVTRHICDLPKRRHGKIRLITSDAAEEIKELKNPIYLAYSRKKRGAGKTEDLILGDQK